MAIEPTLPLMYAQQMGVGGRLVNELATSPEATQGMARHMAEAMLKEQSQQVQRMEDPDLSATVNDNNQHDQGQQHLSQRQQKADQESVAETSPSSEGPFLGNLVNKKI